MNDRLESNFDDFERTGFKIMLLNAVIGFGFLTFAFLLLVSTLYFFLAALGYVPPLDVIPVVPYL